MSPWRGVLLTGAFAALGSVLLVVVQVGVFALHPPPARAVVVAPHPDDAEFMAGGSIAAWHREGASIHYLLVTDGTGAWIESGRPVATAA